MAAVVAAYRSEQNFLALFSPDKQVAYTRDLARAFRGQAPSLGLVARAFGEQARDNWLDIQLTELAAFSGCRDKLTGHQIQALIDVVAEEYGHLKVTEVMYFFRRFKAGAYGKFYGAVDPMVITCALRDFADERETIIARLEREEEKERLKNDPEHRRFECEWHQRQRRVNFYAANPAAFRNQGVSPEEFEELWWLFNLIPEGKNHGYNEW